ncbi:nitrite reductase (NADH) large subunit [Diaminobutyricimonas aerilata]|uniref:assimilatory sulfite reductase (ferredoxin) n=1 Tax=Diaminobutyricimonas aerilata TaxID=1162967 RepID=A0A2M9CIL5_9MICO|nr:nitrite reductase large subunit NirB [Diaminobutyricimonas aerilata]PJJ71763.1 nitrite reductase (NADH) large subunit [Diaminobutyricimonas aerilata]
MTTSDAPRIRHVVVVGGGPAAHRLTDALLARGRDDVHVTVFGEELHEPYDRVALSRRLQGEADLTLQPRSQWTSDGVTLRTGRRVVSIDKKRRVVVADDGSRTPYDDLVLATGSSAPVPGIPGRKHARVYRTIDDVDALVAAAARIRAAEGRPARVVVAGGGLLGLEAAGGLAALGAEVTVVHSGAWLMSAQLDEGAGVALARLIGARGVGLRLGVRPAALLAPGGTLARVALTDGSHLEADLAVFAIGITPRDELAREAGLATGPRGGVVVDAGCRTSDEHIWAIGEVACALGRCVGLVAPANAMAEVVADRLCGGDAVFDTIDDATKLKLAGIDVASFGDTLGSSDDALEVVYADPARGLYQKLVLSSDARVLLGGVFVGDAGPYASLRPMLGRELGGEPASFLSVAGIEGGSLELPDDALVCSCNNVDAGTVRGAVRGEHGPACTDLASLKSCSRAGTQCGSCVPLMKKLLESELTKAGLTVSRALCEHFAMSRQELFDGVRVVGLTSWEAVVERFGSGAGCDVCKPAVASILASQHGSYILDAGRGALQDTNDRALANMQRDGSYSVVPRIPGGEITPEKLAVIASVAMDFGLYTKITGGQRIDMFGARLDQLPDIWKRLVDAGFESGQAYGKALRNVKSCVGSTWCRFGVQDSVGMAVRLELRYRGLRAPHKFKFGVSGCARECAEARGKDVGVIATETGWNLYVGGNGGFQPTHAQLLASDLDDETLIRYIDRYLMYYIRTADRLQRTARWMEDLDGGVDHVREVVVDDSLGLAPELEAAMARHVDTYEDEWAATLADPERLRRFRSFVNAPGEPDPDLVRVTERGQRRPATDEERRVMIAGGSIPVGRTR